MCQFRNSQLSKEISDGKQRQFFYYGLPQNINSHNYPKQIAKYIIRNHSNENIDVIHAHTILPAGGAALEIAKKYNKPFIVTTHGADFYKCIPAISKLRKINQYKKKELILAREVLKKAKYVICVSNEFANDVNKFCPEANIKVIPNSYREDLFYPQNKLIIREELGIPLTKKILISVGNFVETKGHIYILKALPSIIEQHQDIMLILIGGGELKKKYRKICEQLNLTKYVKIMDRINHEKLALWYNAADMFVLPSLNETFGVVLLEALACGLPVIATKTSGPLQIIKDGINGLLVPIRNSSALSNAAKYLLSDKDLLKEMSERALQNINPKYTNTSEETITIYDEIIKQAKRKKY